MPPTKKAKTTNAPTRRAPPRGRKRGAKEDDEKEVPPTKKNKEDNEEEEEEETEAPPALPPVIMDGEGEDDDDAKPAATLDGGEERAIEGILNDPLTSSGKDWKGGQESWNAMLYQLILFKTKNGDMNVTPDDPNRALFNWIQTQRRHYELYMDNKTSSTFLNLDRIAVLDAIDFQWNTRGESFWQKHFDELVAYKREYGDVRVPRLFTKNSKLGEWVTDQRRQFRAKLEGKPTLLTDERKALLDDLGFIWKVRDRADWNDRYEQLLEFKKENGHCIVPQHYAPNRALGKWVAKQREQYRFFREGRHSFLTEERIDLLKSINFTWQIKGRNKRDLNAPPVHSASGAAGMPAAASASGKEGTDAAILKDASEKTKSTTASAITSSGTVDAAQLAAVAPVPALPQLAVAQGLETNPVNALQHQLLLQQHRAASMAGMGAGIGNFNLASALASVPNNFGNAFGSSVAASIAAMNQQQSDKDLNQFQQHRV